MKETKIYNYEDKTIRATIINKESWWVLRDICSVFNEYNISYLSSKLREKDRLIYPILSTRGIKNTIIINDSGLFTTLSILKSMKASRKMNEPMTEIINRSQAFIDWIIKNFFVNVDDGKPIDKNIRQPVADHDTEENIIDTKIIKDIDIGEVSVKRNEDNNWLFGVVDIAGVLGKKIYETRLFSTKINQKCDEGILHNTARDKFTHRVTYVSTDFLKTVWGNNTQKEFEPKSWLLSEAELQKIDSVQTWLSEINKIVDDYKKIGMTSQEVSAMKTELTEVKNAYEKIKKKTELSKVKEMIVDEMIKSALSIPLI
jgi:Prophage antirepressor